MRKDDIPELSYVKFDLKGLTESGRDMFKDIHLQSPIDETKTLRNLDIEDTLYDLKGVINKGNKRVTCIKCNKVIHYAKQNKTQFEYNRKRKDTSGKS